MPVWRDQFDRREIRRVALGIAGQQRQLGYRRMRPDEEIRQHAGSCSAAIPI